MKMKRKIIPKFILFAILLSMCLPITAYCVNVQAAGTDDESTLGVRQNQETVDDITGSDNSESGSGNLFKFDFLSAGIIILAAVCVNLVFVMLLLHGIKRSSDNKLQKLNQRLDILEDKMLYYSRQSGFTEADLYSAGKREGQSAENGNYSQLLYEIQELKSKVKSMDANRKDERQSVSSKANTYMAGRDSSQNSINRADSSSIEEQYNRLKSQNEEAFIRQYRCIRLGIEEYQRTNFDPGFKMTFIEDSKGWFYMSGEKTSKGKVFPIFSASIRSKYFDMFSCIFEVREAGHPGNDFKVVRAARLRAAGNKYELAEKGIIEI